jgi:hypothetical protein
LEKKDDVAHAQRIRTIRAERGRRSPKTGQSPFFVGYKKHTISALAQIDGGWRAIPLYSLARPAGKADVEMLKPLLNYVQRRLARALPLHIVLGDKGYISAERARFLRERWSVALVVAPRADMHPPDGTTFDGCPLCPLGEPLVWTDYDASDGRLIYQGAKNVCLLCPLSGGCVQQFEFSADAHETFWGMIPSHSQLSRRLLRQFRPLTESGFYTAKHCFRLKDFFINSLELAQTLCVMSDIVELLKIIGREGGCSPRQLKKSVSREIVQPELWD